MPRLILFTSSLFPSSSRPSLTLNNGLMPKCSSSINLGTRNMSPEYSSSVRNQTTSGSTPPLGFLQSPRPRRPGAPLPFIDVPNPDYAPPGCPASETLILQVYSILGVRSGAPSPLHYPALSLPPLPPPLLLSFFSPSLYLTYSTSCD